MKASEQTEALSILVGVRLTSVAFVLDYLILGFDGRGLTSLVWPEIIDNGRKSSYGMEGYRDKLCSLIEKTTKSVAIDDDETIRVEFESGIEMWMPLRSCDRPGERAILTGPKHFLYVF
jgi:hypothetical protein